MTQIPWDDIDPQDHIEYWDSIKAETPNAVLMGDEGYEDNVWLPKSQIKLHPLQNGYEVSIPMWLARKKGLV